MKAAFATLLICFSCLTIGAAAADNAAESKQASPEEIKARLSEHAKRKAAEAAEAAKAAKKETAVAANAPKPASQPAAAPAATTAPASPAPAPEPATVLPKVEVKRGRVTDLDQQLGKQNEEIAREKKNTKPTALDSTLNGPAVSKALAIFGGQSSEDRSTVAKERVAMMEEERDLIEAIAQAKTLEEKQELEKTLTDMRAMRRELESSLH